MSTYCAKISLLRMLSSTDLLQALSVNIIMCIASAFCSPVYWSTMSYSCSMLSGVTHRPDFGIGLFTMLYIVRSLFVSVCVYYSTGFTKCQPQALNNPTMHRAIATTLTIICGLFATRIVHIKYSTPPNSPQTMFQGCSCGKKDISTYIVSRHAVPAHCSILFSINYSILA